MRRACSFLVIFIAASVLGCGDDTLDGSGGGGEASSSTGGAGAGGSNGGGAPTSLGETLEAAGFAVQAADFHVIDLASCCDEGRSCSGNNPTSPYGAFYLPPSPEQTAAEETVEPDGTSNAFRLRADEAVVWVGTTPPPAAYFGFTAYLVSSVYDGERKTPFASLGETLNSGVVEGALGEAFNTPIAVIVTPDATTDARVRTALEGTGLSPAGIFSVPFDPSAGTLGLEADASTYGVLFRVALFDDAEEGAAYLANLPGVLYRITPTERGQLDPKPKPAARPKNDVMENPDLAASLDALEEAVRAANPNFNGQSMLLTQGVPDPAACVAEGSGCAGDNRDTNYPSTLPQPFFADPDEFFIVLGVDHRATGKTAYSNFSLYAIDHLVGLVGVSDRDFEGTGVDWLPNDPLAPELFAWKIARDCGDDPSCTVIPLGTCPDGLGAGDLGVIAFRTYLEPETNTAPDVATLIPGRVLHFRP